MLISLLKAFFLFFFNMFYHLSCGKVVHKPGMEGNMSGKESTSFYNKVHPDFWNIVDKQCRTIDMGAAAFYAAARATNKRAAAYFWVTDLPFRGKSFFDPPTPEDIQTRQDRYNRAVSLDMELLTRL